MSFSYSLKIKAYQFFSTGTGKKILSMLSPFISVKNLGTKAGKSESRKPFIVCITIDTESGYVEKNDCRVWQKDAPEAYIGCYKGIENWRNILAKHNVKSTFFLSTNCFSAKGDDYGKILNQLKLLIKGKHEIGLHMHPDSDLALQKSLKRKFSATSAKFYNQEEINLLLKTGKNLIKEKIGINPISFRWGNWALSTEAVKALQQNGFLIDSSATPGIKGHSNDNMAYDWRKISTHYPWMLSKKDYQDTKRQDSKILEIPIATFNFFGLTLRADPANSILLNMCFDYYYKNADRSKKPFIFVVISHSIEATQKDGAKTKVIDVIGDFLSHASKFEDVKFDTLQEAYKKYKKL